MYERLVWEFISYLIVDLCRKFDEVQGCIRFRLFNITHEMHVIRFDELLRLPHFGTLIPDHENYTPRVFGAPSPVLGGHMRHSPPRSL